MHILAAFWDPGNDGFDIGDLMLILAVMFGPVLVLIGWIRTVGKSWLTHEIDKCVETKLKAYTQSIQPGYRNGGSSLTDLSHNLRAIMRQLGVEEEE